ncbi:kinase-like domain-containing protein [Rhizophagus diaphanus]|nr:kinase-like domain-containing protein [Rhizophagus diaphanus] [Rhizophagus sp. MUCL 43196]
METRFNKLNISDEDSNKNSNLESISHKNLEIMIIKDTIYDARNSGSEFVEWVPFDRFEDVKQIGEGGFANVYSATWIDVEIYYKLITNPTYQDFGLSGSNKQKSDNNKICGVLPYIVPEVLNKEPYTLSSDIHSFSVIMAELSSGNPPFYERKHDISLALEICNGFRPEFGQGTPEIYKKLAYKCVNTNSNQRPTAVELYDIINFCNNSFDEYYQEKEKFGYKEKEIKAIFEEADKEIPNISTSYKKNSDAIYTSRIFTFNNLPKPVNSSIITSYLDDDENNKGIMFKICYLFNSTIADFVFTIIKLRNISGSINSR